MKLKKKNTLTIDYCFTKINNSIYTSNHNHITLLSIDERNLILKIIDITFNIEHVINLMACNYLSNVI